ncbi:LOW QUALITY PROTEIN: hypothetical protein TorRG33x02_119710 [Trema orientale]|uniref:Transmembrane protein n=1 Tax=Trema orientale TaxID=63057 RepID=A0A2P5F308_TREOI|nr:LOW QUALITY PROTEIN: hypothetical protein TorRG33x02_119710 [Trema orientale]
MLLSHTRIIGLKDSSKISLNNSIAFSHVLTPSSRLILQTNNLFFYLYVGLLWKNFEFRSPPFNQSALDRWRQNSSSRNKSLSLSFSNFRIFAKFTALRLPLFTNASFFIVFLNCVGTCPYFYLLQVASSA